jgi:hypothetical protein
MSITTFGVSSKDDPNSSIGFFGTGLKYAIAVILRTGGQIAIHSGGKKYEFLTQAHRIRHDNFDVVYMRTDTMVPQPLGFTTELGKGWEVWQSLRELYCNMVDEGGECSELHTREIYSERSTCVVVSGNAFALAYDDRDSVILNTEPLESQGHVAIHPGESNYLYYRGIRTQKLRVPSLYTYNILDKMDLTEDRTFKFQFYADSKISAALQASKNTGVISRVVVADPQRAFDGSLCYSTGLETSEEFRKIVVEHIRKFTPMLNSTAKSLCQKGNLEDILKGEVFQLDAVDALRLQNCIKFCKKIGFNVDEFPLRVTTFLGDGVLGRAEGDTIYLSKRVFLMGSKMVAGTLIEEYLHLKHGVKDCSREMQNFLFDSIVSLGERITKKPL